MDRRCRPYPLVRTLLGSLALIVVAGGISLLATGCGKPSRESKARAQKITNRHQLIGGLNALGEVGDYRLENDEIRLIVQDKGFNRANGLFGGSLIDADLRRTRSESDAFGEEGHDTFGELFPAFFLEVIDPDQVEVINDGSDGEAAVVEVRGRGGEFVTMLRYINQVMINSYDPEIGKVIGDISSGNPAPPSSDKRPLVEFRTRYILEPGARHVRIESTLVNKSLETLTFPNESVLQTLTSSGFLELNLDEFTIPTGHVLGLGAVNDVFVPGIGYDLRWGLEEAYRRGTELPALPGHLTEFVATSNGDRDISYGFFSKNEPETNFPYQKDQPPLEAYDGRAGPNDMLLLFYASGFGGVLTNQMPKELAPSFCEEGTPADQACKETFEDCEGGGCQDLRDQCRTNYDQCLQAREEHTSKYTYTNYFVVGDGDVSSITDEVYDVRDLETNEVRGRVFDQMSGEPVGSKLSLLFYKPRSGDGDLTSRCRPTGSGADAEEPRIFNQTYTNEEGYFRLDLPPGNYCYRTLDDGRPLGDYRSFRVDGSTYLRASADSRASIEAHVTSGKGIPMPAKMTVVGTHDYQGETPKRHFLYDLEAGQPWRTSDFVDDTEDDPSTRRYIETTTYSGADGRLQTKLRPGEYTLYFSRGPEYELETREVTLEPGGTARTNVELEQVVETKNYMSGDFHMHAAGSIDSGLDYDKRVVSIAAEDVEVVVSSDHNYVSDYMPYIQRNGLQPWMRSIVGIELTTFEFGHFNAFPLDFQVGKITRGSIPWQRVPPQKIFDRLRAHGSISPEKTIVQVNHPRDSILGYFGQFGVDGFDTSVDLGFLQGDSLTDRATNVLTTPSGDAFVRDCRPEDVDCTPNCSGGNCNEPRFETKFSWDFDALEIFNGKRLELLRHYRIPYDGSEEADEGDRAWPQEAYEPLLARQCRNNPASCPLCTEDDGCNPSDDDPVWEGPLVSACCERGYQPPVSGASCESSDPSKGTCPVRDVAQSYLSEQYPEGAILCDGGEVAYPGGLDDWYNMLNSSRSYVENRPGISTRERSIYHKVTATGNSDSHHAGKPNVLPPGHPRNYFYAGHDDPQKIEQRDLVEAMQNHRNIVTNGPFAKMRVRSGDETARVGQELKTDSDEVEIEVTVKAADWIGADRFRIMANGDPLNLEESGDNSNLQEAEADGPWYRIDFGENNTFQTTVEATVERDTWFVLEVEGDNSLFPVYPPSEVPRIPFDEIINQIAGSFGFGGDIEGLSPSQTFAVRPFAFTNPIWVVRDGSGDDDGEFTPLDPEGNKCRGDGLSVYQPGSLRAPPQGRDPSHRLRDHQRLDAADADLNLKDAREVPLTPKRGSTRDVRTLFRAWGGH
jgi:hypothetical protein